MRLGIFPLGIMYIAAFGYCCYKKSEKIQKVVDSILKKYDLASTPVLRPYQVYLLEPASKGVAVLATLFQNYIFNKKTAALIGGATILGLYFYSKRKKEKIRS